MKKTTLLITAILGFALALPISVFGEVTDEPTASPVKPQESVDVEAGEESTEETVKPAPKNCPAPPQDKQPNLSADNPISPMKLLAGYQQERLESDDTDYGRIFKKGGADFEYDIGPGAFNPNDFASPQDEVRWSRMQVTARGEKVYVELRKDGFLSVFFPESITRFSGRVRGPEDIADILLMVMTF